MRARILLNNHYFAIIGLYLNLIKVIWVLGTTAIVTS